VKRDLPVAVTVGDLVEVEHLEDGSCCISGVLPRKSELVRSSSLGRKGRAIAANVDQVAVVVAAVKPTLNRHVLDRLLVLAELNEIPAFIVLNKVDLLDDPGILPTELDPYRAAGYPIAETSVKSGHGLAPLGERMHGHLTVFAGATGVGKSSLVNAMIPGVELRVGGLGERSERGRHTTVSGLLIPIPGGGYLADTPGIQYVGLTDIPPGDLIWCFPEFRKFRPECRFDDCLCRGEPGCAVREAVDDGSLDGSRYARYLELLEEALASR
jgi:ribosome biogenesis GTPase / thiamine phosphate phosphatase